MAPSSSPEVAILVPLVLSVLTTIITIGIHVVVLIPIIHIIRRVFELRRAGVNVSTDFTMVAGITLVALIAHLVEITVWAVLYDACGEFTGLAPAFYHSAMNYTSLGYGDVVMSASWKLFGP